MLVVVVVAAISREGENAPMRENVCMLGGRLMVVVTVVGIRKLRVRWW